MIPHIVFEALLKHYMYRSAPAEIGLITCSLEQDGGITRAPVMVVFQSLASHDRSI